MRIGHLMLVGASMISSAQMAASQSRAVSKSTAFDTSMTAIPSGFAPASVDDVAAALRARSKGEYEKTGDYYERTAPLLAKGPFAIRVPLSEDGECGGSVSYDPDAESLSVHILGSETYGPTFGIRVQCAQHVIGTHVGTNAMNAKRMITDVQRSEIVIGGKPLGNGEHSEAYARAMSASVPVGPAAAPAVRSKISAIVVVWPGRGESGSVVEMERSGHEATMSDPRQVNATRTVINASRAEIWIYRRDTGQVFTRCEWTRCAHH